MAYAKLTNFLSVPTTGHHKIALRESRICRKEGSGKFSRYAAQAELVLPVVKGKNEQSQVEPCPARIIRLFQGVLQVPEKPQISQFQG